METVLYICGGLWCLAPMFALALGIYIGSGRLPFRIAIEKKTDYTAEV